MPKNTTQIVTLTSYENQIKQFKAERQIEVSRSQIKRVAYAYHRRQAAMTDTDLERIFMHSDPTPAEAIRNVEKRAA